MVDAISGKLARTGSNENMITLKAGVHDLDNDLFVGEADNEAILGGITTETSRLAYFART